MSDRHGFYCHPNRMLRDGARTVLGIAVAALAIVGCGSSTARRVDSGPQRLPLAVTRPIRTGDARVTIVTPAAGASEARTFQVRVRVTGFRIERPARTADSRSRVGHLHFSLDAGRFDQPRYSGANGRMALDLGVNGFYSPAYRPTIVYRDIPRGRHRLRVELVSGDDRAIGVGATVTFYVR